MTGRSEQLPIALLDSPQARRLADLISVLHDLDFCTACCARISRALADGAGEQVVVRALWTAALVSYARCFASGVREGISTEVYAHVEGDPGALHQFLIDMRNKHVAHSVNPFEQVTVGAVLSPVEAAEHEVVGVANLMMQWGPSKGTAEQTESLVRRAADVVRAQCAEQQASLLLEAKGMPLEQLYQRLSPRTVAPPITGAGQRRER